MTIKKADRLAKEEQYQKVNNCPTSVCCGVHHIINQTKYEHCSHCNICPKYIEYKRQGRKDFGDVKFHYVDTFRECELYRMDMPVLEKPKPVVVKAPVIKPQRVSRANLAAEAYIRLEKNHPELLTFITWGSLFAVCILDRVIKDMDREMRKSPVYKKEVKHEYNKFYAKYKLYINNIKNTCFVDNDNTVIEGVVKEISMDFFKFRVAIENFINKKKVNNAYLMSYLLLSMEVMNEVERIHGENVYNIKMKEKNADLCSFMRPVSLINPLYSVISCVGRHEGESRKIDLNEDINIVNGIKVLYNKIRNPHIITEIIYKITEYHNARKH